MTSAPAVVLILKSFLKHLKRIAYNESPISYSSTSPSTHSIWKNAKNPFNLKNHSNQNQFKDTWAYILQNRADIQNVKKQKQPKDCYRRWVIGRFRESLRSAAIWDSLLYTVLSSSLFYFHLWNQKKLFQPANKYRRV